MTSAPHTHTHTHHTHHIHTHTYTHTKHIHTQFTHTPHTHTRTHTHTTYTHTHTLTHTHIHKPHLHLHINIHTQYTYTHTHTYHIHGLESSEHPCDMPLPVNEWPHPSRRVTITETSELTTYPIEIYTDGSKDGGKVGAGVATYSNKQLVTKRTSYKTAVLAIKQNR